jgi:ATP-dependent Clp protease ATP-binding subunit ClpA
MPKLTTAFQRVTERAALPAQESDRAVVTGADILLAILSETQSPMARPLGEQGVKRTAVLSLLSFGKVSS